VRSAAAALAGLIASPAFRDLQALLARRDHVASFEAQFRTLAIQRTDAEKRPQAVDRVTRNRTRLDSDLTDVGDGLRAAARHVRATTLSLPLPDPPVLRTQSLDDGVDGPDGDLLASVDVAPRRGQDGVPCGSRPLPSCRSRARIAVGRISQMNGPAGLRRRAVDPPQWAPSFASHNGPTSAADDAHGQATGPGPASRVRM
jgi:hypothetical protein